MHRVDDNDVGRLPLLVIGVHTASEAYPNTKYRLEALRQYFDITEVNVPLLSSDVGGLRVIGRGVLGGWRMLRCHAATLARYLALPRPARAYVPYPAVLVLLLWSALPRRLRPRWIVADAFISIFDTVVNDRGLLRPTTRRARLLRMLERRAYATADRIVVDTPQNASFYAEIFSLPEKKFVPIPLSTNETDYRYLPYVPEDRPCRVLFVGTLIPLHGIGTILAAAAKLQHRSDIRFSIIGDGQEAEKVGAAVAAGLANLEWDRTWRSASELAAAIGAADICLGIFGRGAKPQRVCPYKFYAYACVGRPVITGATAWLQDTMAAFGSEAFAGTAPGDPEELVERIIRLAENPEERIRLARQARRFYVDRLGNEEAAGMIVACLAKDNERGEAAP